MDVLEIAGRFELYQRVGSGGMGAVYRARDKVTGDDVAIKLLLSQGPDAEARFLLEARVLAELHHPAIVCYRTHGRTASGELYLAMEWLNGEDLQNRLQQARLTVAETIALGQRVADALAFAHSRGIVHRDIKPGNLFLPASQIERVKLLDFGIARVAQATRLLTSAGATVGTLGYMAPEQARGSADVDARADVFSLGCVLFECLSGKPAFAAEHPAAVLAKILFEDAPGPDELSGVAPRALCEIVARMLAKEPAARPADASKVAAELSSLDVLACLSAAKAPRASALTAREQRTVHMIAVVVEEAQAADWDRARTLTPEEADQPFNAVRAKAAPFGARVERLADGTVFAAIMGSGNAIDQAACAARCAIALRAAMPGSRLSLSTGRGAPEGRWPASAAIDRAVGLVGALSPKQSGSSRAFAPAAQMIPRPGPDDGQPCPIWLDEVTAGLLDARFDVARGPGGIGLRGEREERWTTVRRLLGKPTPCLGRERELTVLLGLFDECAAEPRARVALVTGPAGIGKSRLRHEFLQLVRASAEPPAVWFARSEPLRAGSPFGILSGLLQHAADLRDGEPLEERRQKLRERLEKTMTGGAAARAAAFLGELVSAPLPDEENRELWAARRDTSLMADQVQRAWEAVLAAECAAHPTVLILEDLHWGDAMSVQLLDRALRSLTEQPLFVLALARPDIHDLFCKLWHERDVQEIRLGELPRKACERLVREVLGSAVTEETVGRVAALSAGNAFYLEELIRAVSEGRGDELPETVLTMVEARLSLLPKEARHVLRAGSVFGEFFQQEGVEALLEGALPKAEVKSWISLLTEGEILMTRTDGQLPGNTAFAFRHALLREGAYATLTDADRALGHRLAAVFLERRGDSDPLALAEHFQRGGEAIRAAAHFLRAAKQAARGADSTAAITFARRGLVPGVSPDVRQDLLGVLCEMHAWRAEPAEAWSSADEVMLLSVPGSALWATAAMAKLGSADLHVEGYQETLDALLAVDPAKEAVAVVAYALVVAIFVLDLGGHFELAGAALQRLHAIVLPVAEVDVLARAWMRGPHGYRDTWLNEDPWSGLRESEGAVADFNAIGHLRMARVSQVFVGMNLWFLGDHPGAERELRSAALASTEAELGVAAPLRTFCLVGVLADQGALTEARTEATCALEDRGAQGRGGVRESCARWALAEVLRRTGDLEAAEREALTALVGLSGIPIYHAAATSTLAAIRLAQGNIAMALADAERAMSRYNALGAFGFRGSFARLVHAEALRRAGFQEQARAALSDAQGRLLSVAARMGGGDLARSRSFLENVPENARTLAPLDHARDWCVGRADGAH